MIGELRTVVVIDGPHGADQSQVVGTGTHVREPVADFESTFAVLFKAGLQRHQRFIDLSFLFGRIKQYFIDFVFIENRFCKWCFFD